MKKLNGLDIVVLALVIIGGLNWGLVSLFGLNLVEQIFGTWPSILAIVYDLVGLAAIYLAVISPKLAKK